MWGFCQQLHISIPIIHLGTGEITMKLVHGFTVRQIGPNSLCHLYSKNPVLTGSPWYQARFLIVSVGQSLYPMVLKNVSIALPSMHSYSRKWLQGHWERIGGIVNININLWWPSMILPWEDPLPFLSMDARFVNWLRSENQVRVWCYPSAHHFLILKKKLYKLSHTHAGYPTFSHHGWLAIANYPWSQGALIVSQALLPILHLMLKCYHLASALPGSFVSIGNREPSSTTSPSLLRVSTMEFLNVLMPPNPAQLGHPLLP